VDRSELAAAVRPEAVAAAVAAQAAPGQGHDHGGHGGSSVRSARYKGREIVVRTTYEITVDGAPFDPVLTVDNGGRVHYHGLPTRDFPSTVELVQKAIDFFPGDFPTDSPADTPEHPGDHQHHDHSEPV
jgi:hypothetical protein